MTVRPGQPWRPPRAIDANAQSGAGEHYRRNVAIGEAQRPAFHSQHPLKAKNNTGGTLARGSVVKIGNKVLTALDAEHLWFAANTPDSADATRVAVLLSPANATKIVDCAMTGVVVARVNVTNVGHTFCSPASGQTHFVSGTDGAVPILNTPSATGVQLCAVSLDRSGGETTKRYAMSPPTGGIPGATISSGNITPGSASCATYHWTGTVYEPNGTETIYNPWPDAIAGSRLISYSRDADGLLTIDAEACNAFA